jgi:RNA polymerase sigma factor (sigma-70 family)
MANKAGAATLDTNQAEVDPAFRTGLLGLIPHLRAFARGLCGRPDLADDLVQETVMRAWVARDRYEPGTNMKAWTFTILRNYFLNEIRRSSRLTEMAEDGEHPSLVTAATQEDTVHLSDLQAALHQLSDDRREALLLVGAGGFSYDEAAAVCGVPAGTIKSRVARGRAQLLTIMGEDLLASQQ